jgi:hypothetical protein
VSAVLPLHVVFADAGRAFLLISLKTKSILARSSSALLMALNYTNAQWLISRTSVEAVKGATGCRWSDDVAEVDVAAVDKKGSSGTHEVYMTMY